MYGLVLEGGGSKGAYQIGACRALQEMDIEIGGVSGTSVGAINGAMLVQGDLDKVYQLWHDISPSKVFDVNEDYLNELKNLNLNSQNLSYLMDKARTILENRGLNIGQIKNLIEDNIDEERLRNSPMDFGMVTYSLTDMEPMELFLENIPEGKAKKFLMASAYLPVFKFEKMDGKLFLDGGFYDNLPIRLLYSKGYRKFIAVRTFGMGRIRNLEADDIEITYIKPSGRLGGILDFDQNRARKNLKMGYYDTLRVFKNYKGDKYYIEPEGEKYYIDYLMNLNRERLMRVADILGVSRTSHRRMLFETILPRLSEYLNMDDDSNYEDIVVKMCETLAEVYEIDRFQIYKFQDLMEKIADHYEPEKKRVSKNIPDFVKHSDILSWVVKDELIEEIIFELMDNELQKL